MQLDREHRVLSLQIFRMVIFGEPDGDVLFLADAHADDLLFKSGDKRMRTQGQGLLLGGAAFKLLSVDAAAVIDHDLVSVLRGAVRHVHRTGVAFPQALDLRLHRFVLNIILCFRKRYTRIRADFHFGLDGHGRDVSDAVFRKIADIEIGCGDRLDGGLLFQNFIVIFGEGLVASS